MYVTRIEATGHIVRGAPGDTHRDLATVRSYLTGRTLTKEAIRTAIDVPCSTWYGLLEKGTLITADNLRTAAADLSINRRSVTRYRPIEPEEVSPRTEHIAGRHSSHAPARSGVMTIPAKRAEVSR